ncbi:NFX1-type zinc finger-containing protein 1-like [Mya arenaria]|uniref:NFX1-type zinc finger-containing protein 1-like n=1 Tax=Mya arenaria TaxID=6604 RepID=UPI0022E0C792|nr:NFX1-type zinc finger-containing protein 1-like [Mya arenaria]
MATGGAADERYPLRIFDDDSESETHSKFGKKQIIDVYHGERKSMPQKDKYTPRGRGRGRVRGRARPDRQNVGYNPRDRSESEHDQNRYDDRGRGFHASLRGRQATNSDRRSSHLHSRQTMDNSTGNHASNVARLPFYRETRSMPFHKLSDLANNDDCSADEVLVEISQSRSGFIELVERSFLYKNNALLIMKILHKVKDSSSTHILYEFLQKIEEVLLLGLNETVSKVVIEDVSVEQIWSRSEILKAFCFDSLPVVRKLMASFPGSLHKWHGLLLVFKQINELYENINLDEQIELAKKVFEAVKADRDKIHKEDIARKQIKTIPDIDVAPPDDFRDISIFPKMKDISLNEVPFLRANKVEGKYSSVDTYLDVQFRLLREDYVKPLRDGIFEYQKSIKTGENVKKLRNIRIYHSVQILFPVCTSSGLNHIVRFDNSSLKGINWVASQRLKHGSLVCLSPDNFETVVYAVIKNRDPNKLEEGQLEIHFDNLSSEVLCGKRNATFIMAESAAYFEAYRHVLEGLQEITDEMPMSRYIITCDTKIKPPSYVLNKGSPEYDFTCLLQENDNAPEIKYPVLNTRQWPSCNQLGLDTSQYQALQTAVTKEFALIQGPPGTGKTFVGLKIAKLLLANSSFWKPNEQQSPLLVVCYTNHALDQFLEGMLQFCEREGIVRIGSRCKNANLEPFLLHTVKEKKRTSKERKFSILQSERDKRDKVRESQDHILAISAKLKNTKTQILAYEELEHVMLDKQKAQFEKVKQSKSSRHSLSTWLDFFTFSVSSHDKKENAKEVKELWKYLILTEIQPAEQTEVDQVRNIWKTDLLTRAQIYTLWLNECRENISKELVKTHPNAAERCDENILTFYELEMYLLSHRAKEKLRRLLGAKEIRKNQLLLKWLHLSPEDKNDEIKAVIESFEKNATEDAAVYSDDLEEDRSLDDEEDDGMTMLYEGQYHTSAKRKKSDLEWLQVRYDKKNASVITKLFEGVIPLTKEQEENIIDVFKISREQKVSMYVTWINKYTHLLRNSIQKHEQDFIVANKSLQEVRDMETVAVLKDSLILGMTTTGAAKYRTILKAVQPHIIIVEEAAEVLESHIITSMNQCCEHLILIGDHKQLRPTTTVYELAKKYALDISLFERMVRNEVPCVTLEEQHRMRPAISSLIKRQKLYPCLKDHVTVKQYKNILGVNENVQFITHSENEESSVESTSYSNLHEAKYIAALCYYFTCQGYSETQITVITPYMGQVLLLRKVMPKEQFSGVRITAVDNFQGEENDIILLSLVRSTTNKKQTSKRNPIGFVGIENRICVALSRAKIGLYVVGNFPLLETFSPLWSEIVSEMRDKGLVKNHLTLICENHPERRIDANNCEDFKSRRDGGCGIPCGEILECGHTCPRSCHIVDTEHKVITCELPCERTVGSCPLCHRCTKICFEECEPCDVEVEKTIPVCKHIQTMLCHEDPYTFKCRYRVERELQCQHTVEMNCSDDPKTYQCRVKTQKRLLFCAHVVEIPCNVDPVGWKCEQECSNLLKCGHLCKRTCHEGYKSGDHESKCKMQVKRDLGCGHSTTVPCYLEVSAIVCREKCVARHECGHMCSGTCGLCYAGRVHRQCNGSCGKILPCGHKCDYTCHEICPPCNKTCQWKCSHNIPCKKKCYESCDGCLQRCKYRCSHTKHCDTSCPDACLIEGCNKPCQKLLECNHNCAGICGEKCVCITCSSDRIKEDDGEQSDKTLYLQLPDCSCIFKATFLDKHMHQQNDTKTDLCKRCPSCRKPIRSDVRRYSNILKQIRHDIVEKYENGIGNEKLREKKCSSLQKRTYSLMKDRKILNIHEMKQMQNEWKKSCFYSRCFYYLDNIDKRISQLEELSRVSKGMENVQISKLVEGVMTVPEIRRAILNERRYTTEQYWKELMREISRLDIGINLNKIREQYSRNKSSATIDMVFEKSLQIIAKTQFEDVERETVKRALQNIKEYTRFGRKTSELKSLLIKLNSHLSKDSDIRKDIDETLAKSPQSYDELPIMKHKIISKQSATRGDKSHIKPPQKHLKRDNEELDTLNATSRTDKVSITSGASLSEEWNLTDQLTSVV